MIVFTHIYIFRHFFRALARYLTHLINNTYIYGVSIFLLFVVVFIFMWLLLPWQFSYHFLRRSLLLQIHTHTRTLSSQIHSARISFLQTFHGIKYKISSLLFATEWMFTVHGAHTARTTANEQILTVISHHYLPRIRGNRKKTRTIS